MSPTAGRRRLVAAVVIVAGVGLLGVSVSTLFVRDSEPAPAATAATEQSSLNRTIDAAQAKLRRTPMDPATWALLGTAYIEQARVVGDPAYYAKAQGALEKSLEQQADGNGPALIGMGALANARHDFAEARDWGERARAAAPNTAATYGVLADAYTQLGLTEQATDAVQRMLDIEPGVPSFARASYDLELRGRTELAREAMGRALDTAAGPADAAFCNYHLGELAFDSGKFAEAAEHYADGLRGDPANAALLQGRAKVDAAEGRTDDALAGYRDLVTRVPLPQYLHEYAVLLASAGKRAEADAQFALLDRQRELAAASGATDDLADSAVAADRGDAAGALRLAEAEWARRQNVLVADALAWALHLNGRDAEALGYADKAAALGWRNATFDFHRGMILAGLGRADEAAAALDRALATNPRFSPLHAPVAEQTVAALRGGR
ncbi:tetratricopeptide repeat protein [Actinokineospora sp.]|uniref:tetratricopeptide repeat protein n=1 Tax=Actinokineospora sp. TaxID=1872133 RepID=UPI0040379097